MKQDSYSIYFRQDKNLASPFYNDLITNIDIEKIAKEKHLLNESLPKSIDYFKSVKIARI